MRSKFKLKVFTSLLLTLSFFSAGISGTLLYFSPRGRIANWADWTLFGLTKEGWTDVHITAVAVMLITAVLHLFWFNWKVFLTYLSRAAKGPLRYPRELAVAVLLFALVTVGTVTQLPGVYALIDVRNGILDSFEVEENTPPVAHAEELTLRQAAADLFEVPVEELVERLDKLGWPATPEMTLREISDEYGNSPQQLYDELQRKPEVIGSGAGYGRMTLKELSSGAGISLDSLLTRAEALGAGELTGDEVVKDVAEKLGMESYELLPKLDERLKHD